MLFWISTCPNSSKRVSWISPHLRTGSCSRYPLASSGSCSFRDQSTAREAPGVACPLSSPERLWAGSDRFWLPFGFPGFWRSSGQVLAPPTNAQTLQRGSGPVNALPIPLKSSGQVLTLPIPLWRLSGYQESSGQVLALPILLWSRWLLQRRFSRHGNFACDAATSVCLHRCFLLPG